MQESKMKKPVGIWTGQSFSRSKYEKETSFLDSKYPGNFFQRCYTGGGAIAGDNTSYGDSSVANAMYSSSFGYNAKAESTYSTALGTETHSTGYGSTSVGNTSWTTGDYSVAIGSYLNSDNNGINGIPNGNQSVAVGFRSQSAGQSSVVLGGHSSASGNYSAVLGYGSAASGEGAIAQGWSATASGFRSIAHGVGAEASGDHAVAISSFATAAGNRSLAIGASSAANADNSIALGSHSETSRGAGSQGYVPEGTSITEEQKQSSTWKSTYGEVSVGNGDGTRQITNVAAGTEDTDAVNIAQLKLVNEKIQNSVSADMSQLNQNMAQQFDSMNKKVDSMNRSLLSKIDTVEKEAQAGIAMAIATAGLPQAYLPGKSMMAMSGGVYRGQSGYALGVSHITDNGKWVMKATGSANSQGHFGGSVGVGYQW